MITTTTELLEILSDAECEGDAELAHICRDAPDLSALAAYLKRLALQDVSRAVRLTERLAAIGAQADALTFAQIAAARAYALSLANDFPSALRVLDQALAAQRVREHAIAGANVKLAAVQALARVGRLDEAEQRATEAADAFRASGHAIEAAMADINLGVVRRMLDDPTGALACFDRARPLLAVDPVRRAMIDSNRAEAYMDLDQFDSARRAFEAARNGFLESNDQHAVAVVNSNLGNLLSRFGELDRAMEYFQDARLTFSKSNARGDFARVRAEEAEALAQAGAYADSRRAFADAVATLDEVGMPREAARARLWEAVVAGRAGDINTARSLVLEAQLRFSSLDNTFGCAEAMLYEAELAATAGEHENAIALIERAWPHLAGRPLRALQARLIRARCLIQANRLLTATQELREIDADALFEKPPLLQPAIAHTHGLVHRAAGRVEAAVAAFRRAIAALETTRGTLRADPLRSSFISSQFDVFHDAYTTALDLGGADGIAAAFESLEMMRARTLLDVLQSASSPPMLAEATQDTALELEYRSALSELHSAYAREVLPPDTPANRERKPGRAVSTTVLESRIGDLERRLRMTHRLQPVLGQPFSLTELQARLRPQQAVVKYFLDHGHISAMIVRRSGVSCRRALVDRNRVRQLVQRLRFAIECILTRAGSSAASPRIAARCDEARFELDALLLQPLAEALDGCNDPAFVPVAELHGVPLHALGAVQDAPTGGSYLPSASIGLRLAERMSDDATRGRCGLAIGVSDATAPQMAAEAADVARRVANTQLLAGEAATREGFIARAQQAGWIHLALHGVFSANDAMSTRLRFADGWLTARQLASLRLPGSTVVVASCDTAETTGDAGEERYGLIRALLVAGAGRIIASLWPLHDGTARRFFASYYDRLASNPQNGPPDSAAFIHAIRECQAVGLPWPYWAGLVRIGAIQ